MQLIHHDLYCQWVTLCFSHSPFCWQACFSDPPSHPCLSFIIYFLHCLMYFCWRFWWLILHFNVFLINWLNGSYSRARLMNSMLILFVSSTSMSFSSSSSSCIAWYLFCTAVGLIAGACLGSCFLISFLLPWFPLRYEPTDQLYNCRFALW